MRSHNDMLSRSSRTRLAIGVGLVVAITVGTLVFSAANAATKRTSGPAKTDESVYRCRSASGQMFFGQNIPPECMDMDVEVLDSSGRVVRVIPGRAALEQIEQQKAAEEA